MQQQLSMPARCSKCEAIFDMRYDLQEYSNRNQPDYEFDEEITEENENFVHLCWECRNEE